MERAMAPNGNNHNDNENDDNDGMDNDNASKRNLVDMHSSVVLNQRLNKMRAQLYEQQMQLPPNPNLSPTQFVTRVLTELRNPLMPQSGARTLVRSSSDAWNRALRASIGVPNDAMITEDAFVSALATAISRPKNQYEILVQDNDNDNANYNDISDNDNDATESESAQSYSYSYSLHFPGDVLDYLDGKCWLEAQLRDPKTGKLWAMLGWSLIQNDQKAWLIDCIDWQDFRDEFRPGIGREEWMRICG